MFKEVDDREIVWIQDENGKLDKWFCVNKPEEVAKISFGTPGQ